MKRILAALALALPLAAFAQMPRWTATGNITTSASVITVPSKDFALATITIHGTYAGVTLVFEFSDDSGVTWFADQCVRSDTPIMENGEAIAANAIISWDCGVAATTNFRVRSTAFTSGTGIVNITMTQDQIEPASTVSLATQAATVKLLTAAGTTVTVKATSGVVLGISLSNDNAAVVYVEFFNTTAPTLGVTTPVLVLPIPASATVNIPPSSMGLVFNLTAIGVAAVTTSGGATPGSVTGSVFYQ